MAEVGNVGWPEVALALIAALPGIIAAIASLLNRRDMKTPSGDRIGRVAEYTHDTAIANNLHLRGLTKADPADNPEASEAV